MSWFRPCSALLLAASLGSVGGCGGDGPITAATSKYDVADSEETAATDSAEASGTSGKTVSPAPAPVRRPGNSADAVDNQGNVTPPPGNPGRPLKGQSTPSPSPPSDDPNSRAEQLLTLASQQPRPSGQTPQQINESITQQLGEKIAACEEVLQSQAAPELRTQAAQMKLQILTQMDARGISQAGQHAKDFLTAMQSDPQPDIARQGRVFLFVSLVQDFVKTPDGDFQPVKLHADKTLADDGLEADHLKVFQFAIRQLFSEGFKDEGRQLLTNVVDKFSGSSNKDMLVAVEDLSEQLIVMEADIDATRDAYLNQDPAPAPAEDSPSAESAAYLQLARDLAAHPKAGANILLVLSQIARDFEHHQQLAQAGDIYAAIEKFFHEPANPEVAELASEMITRGKRRLALVGAPVSVKGTTIQGEPFDNAQWTGKPQLIFFLAPSRESLDQLSWVSEIYRENKEKGLQVVCLALGPAQNYQSIFQLLRPEFPVVLDAKNAMADLLGVETLPFHLLLGPDGNVVQLTGSPNDVLAKIADLVEGSEGAKAPAPGSPADPKPKSDAEAKPAEAKPAEAKPAEVKPAEVKPAEVKPAEVKPAEVKPAEVKPAEVKPAEAKPAEAKSSEQGAVANSDRAYFVALFDTTEPADEKSDKDDKDKDDKDKDDKDKDNKDKDADAPPKKNLYAPRPGLSPSRLVDFIFDMEEKPRSIRQRPGFDEALIEAADRILAADAKPQEDVIAVETKFAALHRMSVKEVEGSNSELTKFAAQWSDSTNARIRDWAKFIPLEQEVLRGDDIPLPEIPAVLDKVEAFSKEVKLGPHHLRFASGAVHLINRLEDGDQREDLFGRFGKLFATSADKQLASYGKRLAKPAGGGAVPDVVGKPLELAGLTDLGVEFDWKAYRGKVVIVDFWATWCGPCVREMPNVKAFYKEHREQGLEVVGVSLDKDLDAVAQFIQEKEIPWTTLMGEETQGLAAKYGVRAIPTMMLVDREGNVVAAAHKIGELQEKALELLKGDPEKGSEKAPGKKEADKKEADKKEAGKEAAPGKAAKAVEKK